MIRGKQKLSKRPMSPKLLDELARVFYNESKETMDPRLHVTALKLQADADRLRAFEILGIRP